ncbi:WD40/YVTN repeat-like-containing domain containing protein [Balamuthia mandrillaris]
MPDVGNSSSSRNVRETHYLRVGRRSLLPMLLRVQDTSHWGLLPFEELLRVLATTVLPSLVLPLANGRYETVLPAAGASGSGGGGLPAVFSYTSGSNGLCFTYHLKETQPRYVVLHKPSAKRPLPEENTDSDHSLPPAHKRSTRKLDEKEPLGHYEQQQAEEEEKEKEQEEDEIEKGAEDMEKEKEEKGREEKKQNDQETKGKEEGEGEEEEEQEESEELHNPIEVSSEDEAFLSDEERKERNRHKPSGESYSEQYLSQCHMGFILMRHCLVVDVLPPGSPDSALLSQNTPESTRAISHYFVRDVEATVGTSNHKKKGKSKQLPSYKKKKWS